MKIIRLTVNWLALLTTPIWVLPYVLWQVSIDVKNRNAEFKRTFAFGEKWFWE